MSDIVVGEPIRAGGATVIPLLVERLRYGVQGRTAWAYAERCPVGVLVEREGAARAFAVDGTEHDIEALARAVPAIAAALVR